MFMNSLSGELMGDEIYVISINFVTDYVIWRTREAGGGYVGKTSSMADATALVAAQEDAPEKFQISETHSHLVVTKDPKTGEFPSNTNYDICFWPLEIVYSLCRESCWSYLPQRQDRLARLGTRS